MLKTKEVATMIMERYPNKTEAKQIVIFLYESRIKNKVAKMRECGCLEAGIKQITNQMIDDMNKLIKREDV